MLYFKKTYEKYIESGKRESNGDVFESSKDDSERMATDTERNVYKHDKRVHFDDIMFNFL